MKIITPPQSGAEEAHSYVAVAATTTLDELPMLIPTSIDRVLASGGQSGMAVTGPPFIRWLVIDMPNSSQVHVGFPVDGFVDVGEGVVSGEIPSGSYVSLTYQGANGGVEANRALLDWADEQGIRLDRTENADGDHFKGRVEWLLDGPADDPDPSTWRTRVMIKVSEPSPPTSATPTGSSPVTNGENQKG